MAKQRFTPEELDALERQTSPQKKRFSPEELDAMAGVRPSEAPSDLEAALRGAAQGATFEFSDEATAALESALTGKPYEQALAESRAKYKAAKEAAPVAYGTGELAGAVGSAFIPGIGAVGQVAKGATLGAKVLGGVKAGALAGGLTGLGASEESLLEKPQEVLTEGLVGAGVGGVIGAAAPVALAGAGKAVGKIGEFIEPKAEAVKKGAKEFYETSPMLQKGVKAYELAKEGKAFTKLDPELRAVGEYIADTILDMGQKGATNIDDVVKVIDETKAIYPEFDLKNTIKDLEKRVKTKDISDEAKDKIKDFIYSLKQTAIASEKERLVAAGKVVPGTIEKAKTKVESKLAKERRLVEKELTENLVNLKKVEKGSPEYSKLLDARKEIQARLDEVAKQAEVVTTPEGMFVEGTIAKPKTIEKVVSPDEKLIDRLTSEKAALQRQIDLAEKAAEDQLSPALAEEAVAPLKARLAQIESSLTEQAVPEMGQTALTATIAPPKITEEGAISLGKTLAAPIKKVTEKIPGREIVEPLPDISKIIGEYTPVKPGKVEVMAKPTLTSMEARNLQKDLYKQYYSKLKDMPPAAQDTFREIMEKVKEGVARGDVDARKMFDEANEAFANVKKLHELAGFDPAKYENLVIEGKAFSTPEKAKVITDLARKIQKLPEWEMGISTGEAKEFYKTFIDAFKEIDPAKAEEVDKIVKEMAERYDIGLKSSVRNLLGGSQNLTGFLLGGREALMLKTSIGIGKLARFIKGKPELLGAEKLNPTKIITNMTNDELAQLAEETTGNTKTLLQKIAQNADRTSRNALIFTALQRPEVRKELDINEQEENK